MTDTRAQQAEQLIGPGRDGAQRVPVNLYETTEALVLVAPMPAVGAQDVEITRDGDRLRLRAELRSAAPRDYVLHEWEYGLYERELTIPEGFDGAMTATLGRGQLALSIKRGTDGAAGPTTVHPTDA
jgi:HSP20 family molecular chaperone IbpA